MHIYIYIYIHTYTDVLNDKQTLNPKPYLIAYTPKALNPDRILERPLVTLIAAA